MTDLQPARLARLTAVDQQHFACNADDERVCWICFTTDRDNEYTGWVQPCRCRGSTKWVHQYCVSRWIDEKQRGNPQRIVICPQCQTEYIIFIPELNGFSYILEQTEVITMTICPYIAGGIFVGSLYWIAVTFGAMTFIQVLGPEKAVPLMLNADRLLMLSGLPAIPVGLVTLRLVPWGSIFMRMFQHIRTCARMMTLFEPLPETSANRPIVLPSSQLVPDPTSTTVVICGALVLPTVSLFVGNCLFRFVGNPMHRTALGGVTILLSEALLKLYLRHKQHQRSRNRIIADYNEQNLATQALLKRRQEILTFPPRLLQ